MATQLQIRRGTAAQVAAFTGAEGEIVYNSTNDSLHTNDGSTAGGFELARADGSNFALTSAISTTANFSFGDGDKAIFGAGSDLQIYHDGNNSYITDVGTGNLKIGGANVEITTAGGTLYFQGAANVAKLFHTGNQKLATTASGILVSGSVVADGLTISNTAFAGMNIQAGTGSVAAIDFGDSADTNIGGINYNNADDTLNLRSGNLNRLTINSSGHTLLGTSGSFGTLGTLVVQQTADSKGIAVVDSAAANTFFIENQGDEVKLRVNAASPITFLQNSAERFSILNSGNITIKTADAFLYSPASTGGTYIDAGLKFESSNKRLEFWTADAERMSIDAAGAATFSSTITAASQIKVSGSNAATVALSVGDTGTGWFNTGSNSIGLATSGSEKLRVVASGNVGIGESQPDAKLHIRDSTDGGSSSVTSAIQFSRRNGGSNDAAIKMQHNGSDGVSNLQFHFGNTERLSISAAGTTTITGSLLSSASGAGANAFSAGNSAGATTQGANSVAIGLQAGQTNQGANSTAVGHVAGQSSQSANAVAVGYLSGLITQGGNATSIGYASGYSAQGSFGVSVGFAAGESSQGSSSVAVGNGAGRTTQGGAATAVGVSAGNSLQGASAVAVGPNAGQTSQGSNAVAIGNASGTTSQGVSSVAVGVNAGNSGQAASATSVGPYAGQTSQGASATAVGQQAGQISQGAYASAAGYYAGRSNQGTFATAFGPNAGTTSQGANSVAIGSSSGNSAQGISGVAVGREAGNSNQGDYSVGVGQSAGQTTQGAYASAVGLYAGQTSQGVSATAVGNGSGQTSQGASSVSVGYLAGNASQAASAVAVGPSAGKTSQGLTATAVGNGAGQTTQAADATALGNYAGNSLQGASATAVGYLAGQTSQGASATAVGTYAGNSSQGINALAIGRQAGQTSQGNSAVAVGYLAGKVTQGFYGVAIGISAGQTNQADNSVGIGRDAGSYNQGGNATAAGYGAGATSQGVSAVAVGQQAGQTSQGASSVAVGVYAGNTGQSARAVALGRSAGQTNQGDQSVSVGYASGETGQGDNSVAVGNAAGNNSQGSGAVAIGLLAGQTSQGANGIIINSSGTVLNDTSTGHIRLKSSTGELAFTTAAGWSVSGGNISLPTTKKLVLDSNAGSDSFLWASANDTVELWAGAKAITAIGATVSLHGNLNVASWSSSGATVGMRYVAADGVIDNSTNLTTARSSLRFFNPNGNVGSIQTSGTATSYVTSSDPRLKSEFKPITGASEMILEARDQGMIGEFHFLSDDTQKVWGYNAHKVADLQLGFGGSEGDGPRDAELGAVYEESVMSERAVMVAELDDDGEPTGEMIESGEVEAYEVSPEKRVTPAGIDQSKRVPLLEAAIGELLDRITALENA